MDMGEVMVSQIGAHYGLRGMGWGLMGRGLAPRPRRHLPLALPPGLADRLCTGGA